MRPYDKNLDSYYSPDDTPELYLTENQVNCALEKLPFINEPAEIAVIEVIKEIEHINRMEKTGSITEHESSKKIKEISNSFLKEHGFWPYITKTHERFYKSFE
jgi:hypothetical protein